MQDAYELQTVSCLGVEILKNSELNYSLKYTKTDEFLLSKPHTLCNVIAHKATCAFTAETVIIREKRITIVPFPTISITVILGVFLF